MKGLVVFLLILLLALQYRLWFGSGSVQEVWQLREQARQTRVELQESQARNVTLEAEVRDLKSGLDAIEERARTDLGMIESGETFYRFVRDRRAAIEADVPPAAPTGAAPAPTEGGAESWPALHDLGEPTGTDALVRESRPDDG